MALIAAPAINIAALTCATRRGHRRWSEVAPAVRSPVVALTTSFARGARPDSTQAPSGVRPPGTNDPLGDGAEPIDLHISPGSPAAVTCGSLPDGQSRERSWPACRFSLR